MKKPTAQRVLQEFSSFLLFFMSVGFVVSCCMMLFLNVLSKEMGLVYTPDNIAEAAKITFLNVVIITVLFKTADFIRRRIMVDKPVKLITDAAERIMKAGRSEETYKTMDEAVENINARHKSETLRYKTLYGVDLDNYDNYDLVVDTDGKTPEQIVEIICDAFDNWLKND